MLPIATREAQKRLDLAKKIVKKAKRIPSGQEDKWDAFLKGIVFSRWQEAADGKPSQKLSDLRGCIAMFVILISNLKDVRH